MKKDNKKETKRRTGKGSVAKKFKFKSRVIVWSGGDASHGDDSSHWRFTRVPEDISVKIKEMQKGRLRRGWGAVYAKAKVGKSEWQTSVFPDRRSATYILPLKKKIRHEEDLYDGAEFAFTIEVWF